MKSLKDAIEQDGRVRFFAAKEAVIVAQTPLAAWKLARVTFGKDGSIYVQFPYLKEKQGIVCELPVDPTVTGPTTYRLTEIGTRVPTDVKFSHHTSGVVQFSKTKHVSSGPRRQSFRLDGPIGRVFELNLYWLAGFELLGKPKRGVPHLGFNFPRQHPAALIIQAQWRRKQDIANNIHPPGGTTGPATQVQARTTGHREAVYLFGQPRGYPLRDHVLMISGGAAPLPAGADRPGMIFFGGWDFHEGPADPVKKNLGRCLSFWYPATEAAEPGTDHGV